MAPSPPIRSEASAVHFSGLPSTPNPRTRALNRARPGFKSHLSLLSSNLSQVCSGPGLQAGQTAQPLASWDLGSKRTGHTNTPAHEPDLGLPGVFRAGYLEEGKLHRAGASGPISTSASHTAKT